MVGSRVPCKTLTPRFTDFVTDFEKKKPTVLQSSPLTASITGIQVYVNYDQEGLITIKTPSPSCFAVGS